MHIVMGGTFDPVHIGHLRMATEVSEMFAGESVALMPCFQAVHKGQVRAGSIERQAMLKLAIANNPLLRLDERELKRKSASYSIDSLLELRAEIGDEPLVWVMGSDAAADFESWKDAHRFASLCHLLVLQRPDSPGPVSLPIGFSEVNSTEVLNKSSAGCVLQRRLSLLEVSSSDIRQRVQQKLSIRYLVTDEVNDFICDNALYQ